MKYEVELKFPVVNLQAPLAALAELGAVKQKSLRQRDTYFAHPVRSFAETNEALRVRQVNDENRITYKGPVIDQEIKMRREIEIPFQSGAADELLELLEILGFTQVRSVEKTRDVYHLDWRDHSCEVCIDQVEELGSFLEVETVVESDGREQAKQAVLDLAAELGLSSPEPRSYLQMLLQRS